MTTETAQGFAEDAHSRELLRSRAEAYQEGVNDTRAGDNIWWSEQMAGLRCQLKAANAVLHDLITAAEEQMLKLLPEAYAAGYADRMNIENGRQPKYINRHAYVNSVLAELRRAQSK